MPSVAHTILIPGIRNPSSSSWMEWETTTDSSKVAVGTRYQIGFTFDEYVRFFFGIKEYIISGSMSGFTHPSFGPNRGCNVSTSKTVKVGYRNDGINPIFPGYTNEIDYVVDGRPRMFILNEVITQSPGNTGNLFALVHQPNTASDPDPNPVTGYVFGGLYYPELGLSWDFLDTGTPPAEGGNIGICNFIGPAGTGLTNGMEFFNQTGPFLGSFMGKSMSFWGYSDNGLPNTISATTFTVTANSWWPYDPGDGGGPCWDASDGSQLRSDLPGLT
jgi:hypothetical protein